MRHCRKSNRKKKQQKQKDRPRRVQCDSLTQDRESVRLGKVTTGKVRHCLLKGGGTSGADTEHRELCERERDGCS